MPTTPSIIARLASMLYETVLVAGVLIVFFLLPHILLGQFSGLQAAPRVLVGHLMLVLLLYFGWFWLHGGQTLAMKTWKFRLVPANGEFGQGLAFWQVLLRFLLAWPSVGLGIGILWALFDRDRQFLHDRLAGTRLIRT